MLTRDLFAAANLFVLNTVTQTYRRDKWLTDSLLSFRMLWRQKCRQLIKHFIVTSTTVPYTI